MARTNKKGELFSHLTQFGVFRDKTGTFGSTTLSADLAAGSTAVACAAITNFADQDFARVGAQEDVEIIRAQGAPGSLTITSAWATGKAHLSGDAVVEQTLTDLGHIADDGVKFSISGDDTAVKSAIRRLTLGYLLGYCEFVFEVMLEGFNLENIATALGIAEGAVTGSGTTAAPSSLFLDGSSFRSQNDLCFQATGVRKDGLITTAQFLGVELDIAALQTAFARGNPALIPIRGRCTSGVRLLTNT